MRFWDSSGLIPLFVEQSNTKTHLAWLSEDPQLTAWWGSTVECASAFNRMLRENVLGQIELDRILGQFTTLSSSWVEVQPTEKLRQRAIRLLRLHPLQAADSLQLAAALVACEENPQSLIFVCSDERLREAAVKEGFRVLP